MSLHLVYNAYLGDVNTTIDVLSERLNYLERQLRWLSKVISESKKEINTFVVATLPEDFDSDLRCILAKYGFSANDPILFRENSYEFFGLQFCCELANLLNGQDLIFYCHSKGVVNRRANSFDIFKYQTQLNINADLDHIFMRETIAKAGLFPSMNGWLWHNFFWSRASYLASKRLLMKKDRHYFESFMGDDVYGYTACYSILNDLSLPSNFRLKEYYLPSDIDSSLVRLIQQ